MLNENVEIVAARTGRRLADEIALHCASLPILDERAAEDILGYDERGLTA